MRILVTFAVEAEFAPWRRLRRFRASTNAVSRELGRGRVFETVLGKNSVQVLLTGMGIVESRKTLTTFSCLAEHKPHVVISSGLAGALNEDLKAGDLIAPRRARTLPDDATAETQALLLQTSVARGAREIETLITANNIVESAAEKSRLSFFGQAVDMESAIVMAHFASSDAQVAAVRAISDEADENLPLGFDRWLTPQGEIKPMSLVNTIVRSPGMLPHLVRFGRQSTQAAQKLASFLDNFVADLPLVLQKAAVA